MKSLCTHCLFDSSYSPKTSCLSVRTLLVHIEQCHSHLYNFGAEALIWTGKKAFFHLSLVGKKMQDSDQRCANIFNTLHCSTPSSKVNTRLSFRWFSPDMPIANIQSCPNLIIKIFWHPAVHSNQTGLKLDYIWGTIYFNWCIILQVVASSPVEPNMYRYLAAQVAENTLFLHFEICQTTETLCLRCHMLLSLSNSIQSSTALKAALRSMSRRLGVEPVSAAIRRSCSTIVSAVSVQWFEQNTDYSGSKWLLIEKNSMSCSETMFSKESGLKFTDESRSRPVFFFLIKKRL